MDITLDKEKFDGIKELATISTEISKGKALLSEIKDSTATELTAREDAWHQRVGELLVESEEWIRQIGKNHEELTAYAREVTQFVEDIRAFYTGVMDFRAASDEHFIKGTKSLDEKLAVIQGARAALNKQKDGLDAQRAQDDVLRAKLRNDQRQVKDDEQRLAAAWAELKSKTK
jgi:chromosome segregation ATPase